MASKSRGRFNTKPTVKSVSPSNGSTTGGTSITISGASFVAGATVKIGSASATSITVVSASSITCLTPAQTAGTYSITVTTANGTATLTGGYSYVATGIIYVSQNGAGSQDGSSAGNAAPVSFFNNSANWPSPIGPGSSVHLLGTITTALSFQGSGQNGLPITLLFESGAAMSTTVWPTSGAINTNGHTYLVIDGGANGVIENTQNGTNLANRLSSFGLVADNADNSEIKNLTIRNIYIHASTSDTTVDQTQVRCVSFSGTNFLLHDCVLHDAGWCIVQFWSNGQSGSKIYNNDIYNIDHGWAVAGTGPIFGGPFYFYNNHVHDYANWDTVSNVYHHDGIHAYGVNSGGCPIVSDLWIYNNIFDGDIGLNVTGHIFLEGGACGGGQTPWTGTTGAAHIFNNVGIGNNPTSGLFQIYNGNNHEVYNNTLIGSGIDPSAICFRTSGDTIPHLLIKNNYFAACNQLMAGVMDTNSGADIDYNVYANASGSFNVWFATVNGTPTDSASFATWKTNSGCDAHSVDNLADAGGVSQSTGVPAGGSVVLGAGVNLTSLGIAALDSNISGTARPSVGAWNVGAY